MEIVNVAMCSSIHLCHLPKCIYTWNFAHKALELTVQLLFSCDGNSTGNYLFNCSLILAALKVWGSTPVELRNDCALPRLVLSHPCVSLQPHFKSTHGGIESSIPKPFSKAEKGLIIVCAVYVSWYRYHCKKGGGVAKLLCHYGYS